jgi:two-component system NtrC family response regulator
MTLDESERQQILRTLEKYDNNLTQVATVLGVTRQALYRRLEKHNIKLEL